MIPAASVVCNETLTPYQRLQQALSAGLRRQIFLAVCDRSPLRDRISQQLHGENSLISITLDLENPNFLNAIATHLKQHPELSQNEVFPTFEVLGIEKLTQTSAVIQQRFIRHLQRLAQHLPQLQFSLLLWVSQPWLHQIRQSVPEFWRWHSGVFEFSDNFDTPEDSSSNPFTRTPPKLTTEGQFPLIALKPSQNAVKRPSLPKTPLPPPPGFQAPSSATQAQQNLQQGHYWRDRIAKGDNSPQALTQAIVAYTKALDSEATFPAEADLYNDLGNFYWMRSRKPESPEKAYPDLEKALDCYQTALDKIPDISAKPATYAMIQNNLGAAYGDLARYRDFVENLQCSIQAYEAALRYRSVEQDALKYGSTQNNLGTAYWHLAQQHDPVYNLQAAIAAYTQASEQYSPETDPINWAMIQNNIGTAHWNLSQYEEGGEHLKAAIACYEKSLLYRTPEKSPVACAATQNNLGTAYWHLSTTEYLDLSHKREYLQKSAQAYEIATQIAHELSLQDPPVNVNFNFLSTYNNLGLVHYQLGSQDLYALPKTVQLQHLEAALNAHLQALTTVPPDSEPYDMAFKYVTRTVRAFYQQGGIAGQNRALSQVPGPLLPRLLPKL